MRSFTSLFKAPHLLISFRQCSSVSVGKLPINSLKPIDPNDVAAWGEDAIVLDLPRRNLTEELFDKSKELYLQYRKVLLPQLEGKWVVASAERNEVHIFDHELFADSFRLASGLNTCFVNCIGREVLQIVHHDEEISTDDLEGVDSIVDETNSFPIIKESNNKGNILWRSALWLASTWKTQSFPETSAYMKLDTGVCFVGAPSSELFIQGRFISGEEKLHTGVGGSVKRRSARNVFITHAGLQVLIPEVFEYNKWLLGYPWFKHYSIQIDLRHSPPFVCTPFGKECDKKSL